MKSRWLWVGLFAATLVYLSLFPYNFDFSRPWALPRADWPRTDGDWMDSFLNLLAYLPLGFLARATVGFAPAILLGAGLSAFIEALQSFLPIRHPSLRDLLLNTIGTAIGWYLRARLQSIVSPRLNSFRSLFASHFALTAWLLWFIWQAAPLIPLLRRSQLYLFATALTHPQISWERVASQTLALAFLLKTTPVSQTRSILLAAFGIFWSGLTWRNTFDYSDILGLVLAVPLSFLPWPPLATLGILHLAWLQFHAVGQTLDGQQRFSWLPITGFTSAPFPVLRTTASKALLYGATIYGATRAGLRLPFAAGGVALLLAAGEYAQLSIPGRTPEITDPLLALGSGWLFHRLAKASTP